VSVLKGIPLHVQPGDIYGATGPNGAGKSAIIFALPGRARVILESDVRKFGDRKEKVYSFGSKKPIIF
jgi:ABC-type multidrug transport system ATPase subunit